MPCFGLLPPNSKMLPALSETSGRLSIPSTRPGSRNSIRILFRCRERPVRGAGGRMIRVKTLASVRPARFIRTRQQPMIQTWRLRAPRPKPPVPRLRCPVGRRAPPLLVLAHQRPIIAEIAVRIPPGFLAACPQERRATRRVHLPLAGPAPAARFQAGQEEHLAGPVPEALRAGREPEALLVEAVAARDLAGRKGLRGCLTLSLHHRWDQVPESTSRGAGRDL